MGSDGRSSAGRATTPRTFAGLIAALPEDESARGAQFERICKWYLQNDPEYSLALDQVWLWNEWPGRCGPDVGIDLVARTKDGKLWAIQAKCYEDRVTKRNIDSFVATAAAGFDYLLLITSAEDLSPNAKTLLHAHEGGWITRGNLEASELLWPSSASRLEPAHIVPCHRRPHQRRAVRDALAGFQTEGRGQLVMACGTGKTLAALWIAEDIGSRATLVLVPSLSLLKQTIREWSKNRSRDFDFLAVCSDDTVGKDEETESTGELGVPVTTYAAGIASFLRRRGPRVVMATYQSSPRIAEAQTLARVPGFDLVIADEAHRCTGVTDSAFATVLGEGIRTKKRLFMTATPRTFTGRVIKEGAERELQVASMDDTGIFGEVFHRLSFADAIEQGLLSDYRVVVVGVSDDQAKGLLDRRELVRLEGVGSSDARTVASQIALAKATRDFDLRRVISFHARVSAAGRFADSFPKVVTWLPARHRPSGKIRADMVSGKTSAGQRERLLQGLRDVGEGERAFLSNARCLSEGIDVPALDGIAFIDPKHSEVDIVQAVGRAMRKADDKREGTIIVPVFLEVGEDDDEALSSSRFRPVWDVVRALRSHDEELGRALDDLRIALGRDGEISGGWPDKLVIDLPKEIARSFADAFRLRVVEQTTASWEFWFGLLQGFVEQTGQARPPQEHEESGFRLGKWVNKQRDARRRGTLGAGRERKLAGLEGWTWSPIDEAWGRGFSLLQTFATREGHSSPRRDQEEAGFRLGEWVITQRAAKSRLDPDRRERLETLPTWTWTAKSDRDDAAWRNGLSHLRDFARENGTARVAPSYVADDGFALGRWVNVQKKAFRDGDIRDERTMKLASFPGWTWGTSRDRPQVSWEEYFRALQGFVDREGRARVRGPHVEGEYRLGAWVVHQRQFYRDNVLSVGRIERLESLPGWTWNAPESRWDEWFELLSRYVEREGNAHVPVGHLEDGERLGTWVKIQRRDRRSMSAFRRNRLEALPGWAWNGREAAWEEGFALLADFAATAGHAMVPGGFASGEFRLGEWVQTQRRFKAEGRLRADRIERLESLPGWAWDTKAVQRLPS